MQHRRRPAPHAVQTRREPMSLGEFDLIAKFFTRPVRRAALGVGDDCALFTTAPGMQLAVSSDMLVAGRHFFADTDPEALGHKTLAVNLSDLAAMGARPRWALLAGALPDADRARTHLIRSCRLKRRWRGDQIRKSAPRLTRIVRTKTPSSFVIR